MYPFEVADGIRILGIAFVLLGEVRHHGIGKVIPPPHARLDDEGFEVVGLGHLEGEGEGMFAKQGDHEAPLPVLGDLEVL